jgi:hypothetical protein
VPGKDGHGPDADEVRKLKELHARWMKKPPTRRSGSGPSGPRRGTKASRGGSRKTRG